MEKAIAIVIPTYNERVCLKKLLDAFYEQKELFVKNRCSLVIVDDNSPDGTAIMARTFAQKFPYIHIITGSKKGLGAAYKRGFKYALHTLGADIVVQMDADGSHDINYIPQLINCVSRGHDLVIGSRYIPGGTLPKDWSVYRILNSRMGNVVARYIAGLHAVKDCTSGLRAWDRHLLQQIPLDIKNATGFSFQINTLAEAVKRNARILEIPIDFKERLAGYSKMRFYDQLEFIGEAWRIGMQTHKTKKYSYLHTMFLGVTTVGTGLGYVLENSTINLVPLGIAIFCSISGLLVLQNLFTLWCMMYCWNNPKTMHEFSSPKEFVRPKFSFTALLPALHEEKVISETIRTIDAISYPEHLKEIIVICRADDVSTIKEVQATIADLGKENIRLVVPPFQPKNKPDKLNYALERSHNDVVCVFDAEDNPHTDIYSIINTVMVSKKADVVQSGVQLMNFRSHWFSTLNVLEYYFWFKSVLHLFAKTGTVLLGGNTVFFKREWLLRVDGWDANCLTEDADIGIRLSVAGAKINIIYEEVHATKEETPPSTASFIRQRTRWNQGFLQVLRKQDWRHLPNLSQRTLVRYLLAWPEIQVIIFFYSLAAIVMMFTLKLPILLALISFLPFYLLVLYVTVLTVGLYEFTKKYHLKFPFWMPLKILVTFFPFQFLLGISALRAVYRNSRHKTGWEKTQHTNAHRAIVPITSKA